MSYNHLYKSHAWEYFCSQVLDQNVFNQSDFSVLWIYLWNIPFVWVWSTLPKHAQIYLSGTSGVRNTLKSNWTISNIFERINPFPAHVHILYPLKTPANLRFSDIFRRYGKRSMVWDGLKWLFYYSNSIWNCDVSNF